MNKIITFTFLAACVLVVADGYVSAQNLGIDATTQVDVNTALETKTDSDANKGKIEADGSVKADLSVEAETSTRGEAEGNNTSGEKDGTEDINIGVGELKGGVSVSSTQVRGWDPEKKEAFLADVKTHAEVRSEQELEHFAQGVLVSNENVESVETNTATIAVSYKVPARLFGIFKTKVSQKTSVKFDESKQGRVKVSFPWTRIFYKVDAAYQKAAMAERITPALDAELSANAAVLTPAAQASIIQKIADHVE